MFGFWSSTFLRELRHPFPKTSLCRITSKITVKCKFVVFTIPCFMLASLVCVVNYCSSTEVGTANISRMISSPPTWLREKHLPNITSRPVVRVPCCVMIRFDIFIMSSILWLCQTQGLFKIYASVTHVTKWSQVRKLISGSLKKLFCQHFPSSIDATLKYEQQKFPYWTIWPWFLSNEFLLSSW